MSVVVKCNRRPYNLEALKSIIECCGGEVPAQPYCPPSSPIPLTPSCYSSSSPIICPIQSYCSSSNQPELTSRAPCCMTHDSCTSSMPRLCMSCPPMRPIPPCPPRPFICPPCTGAYIACAPIPKPVPAPSEPICPVLRTPMNVGGLFYNGIRRQAPVLSSPCCTSISGMFKC